MKLKNEQGITLVELLAVLVLVAIVATLIMTTFFITNRYNLTETKKLKMQQDANYIITTILAKHRTVDNSYFLKLDADNKLVYIDASNGTMEVIGETFEYDITEMIKGDGPKIPLSEDLAIDSVSLSVEGSIEVEPKKEDLTGRLIVKDPKNPELSVEVVTTFKRYKSEK